MCCARFAPICYAHCSLTHRARCPPPSPPQGEREGALRDFASGAVRVLVATDVASRGLDIKGIGHVVNMDLPKTFEVGGGQSCGVSQYFQFSLTRTTRLQHASCC